MFPSTVILSNYLNSIDKFFLFYDWGFDVYRAPTMWQALYPAPPAPRLHLYQLELSLQELRNCHHFRRDETGSDSPASPNLSVPKQMSGPRFSWFSGGCTGNPYFWIGGGGEFLKKYIQICSALNCVQKQTHCRGPQTTLMLTWQFFIENGISVSLPTCYGEEVRLIIISQCGLRQKGWRMG